LKKNKVLQYSYSKKVFPISRVYIDNHIIKKEKLQDTVITETPLTIFINDKEIVTIQFTPPYQKELAAGYLYTERYISGKKDILGIEIDEKSGVVRVQTRNMTDPVEDLRRTRFIKPDCTNPVSYSRVSDAVICQKVKSEFKIKAEKLLSLVKEFSTVSTLYKETGGVHSAVVCTENEILFLGEDIGRHNALDKVIGFCILQDISLKDKIILTSGRSSSSVCLKIVKAGVPVLVSRSAPTSESVRLCHELGVTLIGFARGRRMNIYTHPHRLFM